MRVVQLGLALCLLLGVCSCFSYSQEIWINPDGSGRLKLDLGLGKALMGMGLLSEDQDPLAQTRQGFEQVKADLEANPEVKSVKFEDFTEGDVHHFTIDIEVKDYHKLSEIDKLAQPKPDETVGSMPFSRGAPFKLEEGKGGVINFSQNLDFGIPKSESKEDQMAQMMAAQLMSNYFYTVTIHAPRFGETTGELAKDKKSVSWKVPMGELISGNYNRELTAEIMMPATQLWLYLIGPVVLVLLIALIALINRRKRSRPVPQPPTIPSEP